MKDIGFKTSRLENGLNYLSHGPRINQIGVRMSPRQAHEIGPQKENFLTQV